MTQGQRFGGVVGAVGGLAFVLANAGALPAPLALAARVAGVALVVAVLALVVVPRPTVADEPPDRGQLRAYGVAVLAMVVGIVAGSAVLRALGRADLQVLWVVAVVGLHFLPLARAFGAAVLRHLGLAMAAVAVAGAVVAVVGGWEAVPQAAAVVAGLVMLGAALSPRFVAGARR